MRRTQRSKSLAMVGAPRLTTARSIASSWRGSTASSASLPRCGLMSFSMRLRTMFGCFQRPLIMRSKYSSASWTTVMTLRAASVRARIATSISVALRPPPRQRGCLRPLAGFWGPPEPSLDVLHLNFECEAKWLSCTHICVCLATRHPTEYPTARTRWDFPKDLFGSACSPRTVACASLVWSVLCGRASTGRESASLSSRADQPSHKAASPSRVSISTSNRSP
jgi:hypothetical protein